MSSGRGPGMIGMVLALIVLVGFGALFVLVFDESFQGGGPSLQSILKEQKADMESLNRRITYDKDRLARSTDIRSAAAEFAEKSRENEEQKATIAELQQTSDTLKSEIGAKEDAFEAYKDEYREYVRNAAVGEKMAALISTSGRIYKDVEIREVNSVGMQIRHQNGLKRIPYEELPEIMRDRFQFDEEQKQELIRAEREMQRKHEMAVAAARQAKKDQAENAEVEEEEEMDTMEANKRVIVLRRRAETLSSEIKELRRDIKNDMGKAYNARIQGKQHTGRTTKMEKAVDLKLLQLAKLREMIKEAESKL